MDGLLTPESRRLFEGVDLLIHDGFKVNDPHPSYASVRELVEYAKASGIPKLVIVHMDRPERSKYNDIYLATEVANSVGVNVSFPNDGNVIEFPENRRSRA